MAEKILEQKCSNGCGERRWVAECSVAHQESFICSGCKTQQERCDQCCEEKVLSPRRWPDGGHRWLCLECTAEYEEYFTNK